jgi:DNA primase
MVFCFDGDRAGREAAWRALENTLPLLREGRQAGFLFLPENEDPDSLVRQQGRKVFEQLLQQSLSLSEYFFQHLTARNDINTLEGRARMVEQAQPLLQRLPESVLKDMLFQQLTDIARISLNRLNPAKSNHVKPARAISDKQVRRTPPRYAIALLLKEPELAQQAGDTRVLHGLDIPGIPLLAEIIEFLKVNPHISYLWEKYRDTETKQILSQLINWQPLISESLFAAEFLETMQQINKLTEDYVFDKLRQSSFSALNEDERALLRNYRKST